MIFDRALAERAAALLNDAFKLDPGAVQSLVDVRVPVACQNLADHPTIQCGTNAGGPTLGTIGLLNGLCGVRTDGTGPIAAVYEDGKLLGFKVRES